MKTVIVYMLLLVAFVHFHTTNGPTPLYDNGNASPFPVRVISSINQNIDQSCLTDDISYRIGAEEIFDTEESFVYQVKFASSALNHGKVVIEQKHSGEVVLQKVECPGKNGQWYSYNNSQDNSRKIAGL